MSPEMRKHFSVPRDQDGTGWCYAFTAADLISAEVGVPLSSTHTTTIFNRSIDDTAFLKLAYKIGKVFMESDFESTYEGGWVDMALEKAMKNKEVCKESALPFDGKYWGTTSNMVQKLEEVKKHLSENADPDYVCSKLQKVISKNELNISLAEIQAILVKENMNTALDSIVSHHCQKEMVELPAMKFGSLRTPRLNRRERGRDIEKVGAKIQKYFEKIDSLLKNGKPIGISYNSTTVVPDQGGGHASVVVARRWRAGKCEFKIRNSWGRTCESYDENEISGCDYLEGSYWVTDQKFYEMANKLNYIDG